MSFKDIPYLELWRPIRSAKLEHLCYFCRGHCEKYFSKIILNLDQVQEEMSFKLEPYVQFWVEDIIRNISVNVFATRIGFSI